MVLDTRSLVLLRVVAAAVDGLRPAFLEELSRPRGCGVGGGLDHIRRLVACADHRPVQVDGAAAMNGGLSLVVIAGGVLVIAIVWIFVTRDRSRGCMRDGHDPPGMCSRRTDRRARSSDGSRR